MAAKLQTLKLVFFMESHFLLVMTLLLAQCLLFMIPKCCLMYLDNFLWCFVDEQVGFSVQSQLANEVTYFFTWLEWLDGLVFLALKLLFDYIQILIKWNKNRTSHSSTYRWHPKIVLLNHVNSCLVRAWWTRLRKFQI